MDNAHLTFHINMILKESLCLVVAEHGRLTLLYTADSWSTNWGGSFSAPGDVWVCPLTIAAVLNDGLGTGSAYI